MKQAEAFRANRRAVCAYAKSVGFQAGLIQSLSQSPWPKLSACGVLDGIASISCLNSLLPQLILI
jgi:hypothetical protein